jgi:uncharacterized protein (DUF3084 family)
VHTPIKGPPGAQVLHTDIRTYNQPLTSLRADRAGPRAAWPLARPPQVTPCPWRIGAIAAAAPVLTSMQRGRW